MVKNRDVYRDVIVVTGTTSLRILVRRPPLQLGIPAIAKGTCKMNDSKLLSLKI
jgi:hypothetical protein